MGFDFHVTDRASSSLRQLQSEIESPGAGAQGQNVEGTWIHKVLSGFEDVARYRAQKNRPKSQAAEICQSVPFVNSRGGVNQHFVNVSWGQGDTKAPQIRGLGHFVTCNCQLRFFVCR